MHSEGLKCVNMRLRPGRPRWGSLQRSPNPLAGFEGGRERGGREGEREGEEGRGGEEGKEGGGKVNPRVKILATALPVRVFSLS